MTEPLAPLPVRLRAAAESVDHFTVLHMSEAAAVLSALLREAAANVFADIEILEADLVALRGAYLEAAGTNATISEIVGAVRRGATGQAQMEQMEADCAELRKAYSEASGGKSPTVAAMVKAIHLGAR